MSFMVVLIGTRHTQVEDIERVVDFHLLPQHSAVWSDTRRPRLAGGTRVVAKVAGAQHLALTGQLTTGQPIYEPLESGDQKWDWRYDVRWDGQPRRSVPVQDVGDPFDRPTRSMHSIGFADFRRAHRALHGADPPRQDGA